MWAREVWGSSSHFLRSHLNRGYLWGEWKGTFPCAKKSKIITIKSKIKEIENRWLIWTWFVCGYSCSHERFIFAGPKLTPELWRWHFGPLALLILCSVYFLSIFRRPYYTSWFLPALLRPRVVSIWLFSLLLPLAMCLYTDNLPLTCLFLSCSSLKPQMGTWLL